MNSSFLRVITVLALSVGLALTAATFAFAGTANSGQSAGEPLGAISAGNTPKTPTGEGDEAGEFGSGSGEPPADVKSEGGSGAEPGSGAALPSTDAAPAQGASNSGSGSGSGASLPFTGYVAIPVLLAGVALLGTGIVMRRRSGASATA